MEYVLTTPISVGLTLDSQIQVSRLQLASISLNFEPFWATHGRAVLSVVMVDPDTGNKVLNIVYDDASALAFWEAHKEGLTQDVFAKLIADNKLPAGTLA
jgi:hypothetical protein